MRLLLLLVVLLIAAAWPAVACTTNTYYLDPAQGSDANDCATEQTACQSAAKLQTLLQTVMAGQQILLKRGTTLVVTATLTMKYSGLEGKPIVLGAYGPGDVKPVLDSTTMAGGAMQIYCQHLSYWTIENLHFKARKGAVAFASCHHSTLQHSEISQCDQECIRIYRADPQSYSSFISIKGVTITAPTREEGIYIGTDPGQAGDTLDLTQDILLDHVTIRGGTSHECVEMKAGAQRVTVQSSTFQDMTITQNGCLFSSTGTDPAVPLGNHVLKHNTLRGLSGSQGYGIRIRNSVMIEGNDVSETSQVGIFLESLAGYPTYKRTISVQGAVP